MSKIKKLLLILICLLVSFEVGSESNNLDDEDLYVIIVELEHNNKIYIKDATPFVTDCDEGIKRAENTFRRTPDIKLKSVKCKKLSKKFRKEIKGLDQIDR